MALVIHPRFGVSAPNRESGFGRERLVKMIVTAARKGPVVGALLGFLMIGTAVPALAQTAAAQPEVRLRKLEAEVRALQRQVFPGSDGKFFTPEITAGSSTAAPQGTPAATPVSDLLTRMEAVEAQISRLTAQNEETANRVAQMEARLAAMAPPAVSVMGPPAAPEAAVAAAPATAAPAAAAPVVVPTPVPSVPAARPAAASTRAAATAARPAAAAKPSAARIAAVQRIEKPSTGKAAEDEYSYGFRLWEAKFYPEAQQQLRFYVDKFPRDEKISFGRNLLGRSYLDDGKPREAAPWFLQNYQSDRKGARSADSLLFLAESMRQLKDTSRSCIALAEFAETYPAEAAGRLKSQYDATRSAITCP